MKVQVGDKVVVISSGSRYYGVGAVGFVHSEHEQGVWVAFCHGKYKLFTTYDDLPDNTWSVALRRLLVITNGCGPECYEGGGE